MQKIMAFTLPKKNNKSPKHWWFSIGISWNQGSIFRGYICLFQGPGYLSVQVPHLCTHDISTRGMSDAPFVEHHLANVKGHQCVMPESMNIYIYLYTIHICFRINIKEAEIGISIRIYICVYIYI